MVKEVTDRGTVQLVKLNGEPFPGKVNGRRLKPYTSGLTIWLTDRSTVFMTQGAGQGRETINTCTRSWYQRRDMSQMQMIQKQEWSRSSRRQNSALWTFAQHRHSWRGSMPRSLHQQSDSGRVTMIVLGAYWASDPYIVGFWGLMPEFWSSVM